MVKAYALPLLIIAASAWSITGRIVHRDMPPTDTETKAAQTVLTKQCTSWPITTFPAWSLTPLIGIQSTHEWLPSDGLDIFQEMRHDNICAWIERDGTEAFKAYQDRHPMRSTTVIYKSPSLQIVRMQPKKHHVEYDFIDRFTTAKAVLIEDRDKETSCPLRTLGTQFDCRPKGYTQRPKKEKRKLKFRRIEKGRKHVTENGWPVIEMTASKDYATRLEYDVGLSLRDVRETSALVFRYGFVRSDRAFSERPIEVTIRNGTSIIWEHSLKPHFGFQESQFPIPGELDVLSIEVRSDADLPQRFAFDAFIISEAT